MERKRKILQVQDNNICSCHLPSTVWQTQTMCSSEVERKRKILHVQDINMQLSLTGDRHRQCVVVKWRERERYYMFKILICSCHLPATMWQTQTMCGSEVERKRKILQVQDINMQLSLTFYSVADTDNV